MGNLVSHSEFHPAEGLFYGSVPYVMHTRFDVVIMSSAKETAETVWEDICTELERLWHMLDRFDPASEVSALNSGAALSPVRVSETMVEVLRLCAMYHERTMGIFDVTKRDFSRVRLEGDTVTFTAPDTFLDLGGFAKGYAVRKVRDLLSRAGIEDAYVDFGGSTILGMGHHPFGDSWKVSLQNPFSGEPIGEFSLRDSTLSTSGNTPEYAGHIINPRTGAKIAGKIASTVMSPDPLDAEVLSTVWLVAGAQQRQEVRKNFPDMIASVYEL